MTFLFEYTNYDKYLTAHYEQYNNSQRPLAGCQ